MTMPERLNEKFGLIKSRRFHSLMLLLVLVVIPARAQEPGVTETTLRLGSTMALEGDARTYGRSIRRGLEAALKDQSVQGRRIEFVAINDFYDPAKTVEAARQLISQGVFAMLGNMGAPTTRAILPLLAERKIPLVGPYTGAGFTGPGDILNFRPSYAQEVIRTVEAALAAGVKPAEVCAFVQNDAYGMAGVQGLKAVLAKHPEMADTVAKLDRILTLEGASPQRNNIGPVGVYQRGTLSAREGYKSIKEWEQTTGNRCRLAVTVATFDAAAGFTGYARYKGESWVFALPSAAATEGLRPLLAEQKVSDGLLVSQVVPALDSPLPIVKDARTALGQEMDYISLEMYIVGRMFLDIMRRIEGGLSRESFLRTARSRSFDLGGLPINFTDDNQGSDLVSLTYLQGGSFQAIEPGYLAKIFQPSSGAK